MNNTQTTGIEQNLFEMFAEVERSLKEAELQEVARKRDLHWIMNPPHFTFRYGPLHEMRLATGENIGDFAIYAHMHWQEVDDHERAGTFPSDLSDNQRQALTELAAALIERMKQHGDTRKATRMHEDCCAAGLKLPSL